MYDMTSYIANKHQSGYLSPLEFDNSFNLSQIQYQQELVDVLMGWDSNGKRIKNIPANTKQVKQKLSPFIVKVNNASVNGSGELAKPADLECITAMRKTDNKKRIWRVEEERLPAHLSSAIDPLESNPIYEEGDGLYQIYPIGIGNVNFEYIRKPTPVVYGYTMVSGRPIYDPGSSVQPEWGDGETSNLLIRVLFMFGISIQAQNLISYYNEVKQNGE